MKKFDHKHKMAMNKKSSLKKAMPKIKYRKFWLITPNPKLASWD